MLTNSLRTDAASCFDRGVEQRPEASMLHSLERDSGRLVELIGQAVNHGVLVGVVHGGEFIELIKLLDAACPAATAIKLILDNHPRTSPRDQSGPGSGVLRFTRVTGR